MWLQVPSKSHSIVIIESLHFGCGLICLIVSKRDMIALPGFFTMKALFFRANPLHLQVLATVAAVPNSFALPPAHMHSKTPGNDTQCKW